MRFSDWSSDVCSSDLVYQRGDDLSLQSALHADDGEFVDGHWHLTGIARTRFEDGHIVAEKLPTLDIEGHLSPDVLRLFVLEADSLTTPGLMRLIRYLERKDRKSTRLNSSHYCASRMPSSA